MDMPILLVPHCSLHYSVDDIGLGPMYTANINYRGLGLVVEQHHLPLKELSPSAKNVSIGPITSNPLTSRPYIIHCTIFSSAVKASAVDGQSVWGWGNCCRDRLFSEQ